jgi:hypothetical protein
VKVDKSKSAFKARQLTKKERHNILRAASADPRIVRRPVSLPKLKCLEKPVEEIPAFLPGRHGND